MSPTHHLLSPGAGNPSSPHTPPVPHLLTHSQPTCPVILGLPHHLVFALLASGKQLGNNSLVTELESSWAWAVSPSIPCVFPPLQQRRCSPWFHHLFRDPVSSLGPEHMHSSPCTGPLLVTLQGLLSWEGSCGFKHFSSCPHSSRPHF